MGEPNMHSDFSRFARWLTGNSIGCVKMDNQIQSKGMLMSFFLPFSDWYWVEVELEALPTLAC